MSAFRLLLCLELLLSATVGLNAKGKAVEVFEEDAPPPGCVAPVIPVDQYGAISCDLKRDQGGVAPTGFTGNFGGFLCLFNSKDTINSLDPNKIQHDADDASYLDNGQGSENIALVRQTKYYTSEGHPWIACLDTFFISLFSMTVRNYGFKIYSPLAEYLPDYNFNVLHAQPTTVTRLVDLFANTSANVSLIFGDTMFYKFSVTSAAASQGANRFRLEMGAAGLLPIGFIANAVKTNKGVQVSWKTGVEYNVLFYEVEKSKDGTNFTLINTAKAYNRPESEYGFTDAAPFDGVNYYRIRSVDADGSIAYSKAMRVSVNNQKANSFLIYPNPIKSSSLSLQLNGLAKGSYNLRIYNTLGQLINSQQVKSDGGNTTENINLGKKLTPGYYKVCLGDGLTQTLVAE